MSAAAAPSTTSPSRRALLAGALGGLGALAASAIGRASPVRGADGDAVEAGGDYTASSATGFATTTTDALYGSSGSGAGVVGSSSSGVGVQGFSSSGSGVLASSGAGLFAKAKTAVYGYAAQDSTAKGLWGETTSGHAVQGTATSGFAGYFQGKVYTTRFHEMREISTPGAPGANRARLFIRDNGSGKTQLCVRYATGAVQVLNTQP